MEEHSDGQAQPAEVHRIQHESAPGGDVAERSGWTDAGAIAGLVSAAVTIADRGPAVLAKVSDGVKNLLPQPQGKHVISNPGAGESPPES